MSTAPIPLDDAERLRALHRLDVLDSEPEREFDALVAAAALVCGVPISLVSLVDTDRQWFKANVGLPGVSETPREVAFCAHTIMDDGIFEVPDATQDARFAANPLVTAAPDIRFYAGATLRLSDGAHVGTLCVIDREPRRLTAFQRTVLSHLACAAVQALESRRMARGFAASEARFRALSEAAPLGVFATDAEGGCIYTNARWQAIFGLTDAQAVGDGWGRTLHPDDKAAVLAEWQRTAALRIDFDMEFRVRHDDGTVRHVRSISRPVTGDDGKVSSHVGSVEDVTDRRAQESRLRKSEQLLNRTGAIAAVGGWELDLLTGELEWSEQTCRIHGVAPGHRPRLTEAINFYAPEARPAIRAAVERSMADGQGWDLELPFNQANGNRIWVRAVGHAEFVDGKPVRLLGAIQDITQRVQQRLALEAARDRMALATDSGGIGVWDLDVQAGTLIWDAWMYRLYGLPLATQSSPYDLWACHLHPEDRAATEQALRDAIAGDGHFEAEFRIVWADASVHHLRAAARITRDASGKAQHMVGVNWDVTPMRRLASELAQQHELLRVTLKSIGDAVITTDAAGCVAWMNPVAERMTGWLSAEALGRPLPQVFHIVNEETRQPAESQVAACLHQGKVLALAHHTVLISRNGGEFGVEDSAAPIRNARGDVLGVVLVFHDVTEQRRLSGEMSYRATHDALTGLINRAEFEARLQRTLSKSHEDRSQHAMLFIDLDQFKLVNDACGHSVGDQLLQQVSKLLTETVRARDTLARLGGDEFAVLLEHCTTDQAQRVAQKICDRMDDFRFVHDERRFRIGASIGLVPVDQRWATVAAAIQAADTSCYAAKEAGRNRVHAWFDTDQAMRARHGEMQWATRLEQALDEDRFVLHAQRIDALAAVGRGGLHVEVLIRLLDSDGSLIPPGAFLPAAERFHLATRIDRWVLKHAMAHLSALPDLSAVDTLCINLSGQSIGDRAFHRHAIDALTAAGAAVSRRICLEITETSAVTNMADAAVFIDQVRALGVRIALDDFGAGASSFGYLKTLKVDLLKIDGQFIKDLIEDPLDDAAVRCFADVARVVGVKTVAEFVDRPEILERVREIGIDYAQGFLLHRPEPIEQVLGLARRPARVGAATAGKPITQ
jgi:diguanylate cyclase (GGDEF)-like protein/PAS domain S-box-containing protein